LDFIGEVGSGRPGSEIREVRAMSVATEFAFGQGAPVALTQEVRPMPDSTHYPQSLDSALLSALLNQEHLGVGVCSGDGALTMLNPTMEEMLGEGVIVASAASWARRYHLHDEHGEPLAPGQDPLARALGGETVASQVICVRHPEKEPRFMRCNAFPIPAPGGGVLAAVVLATDITDWVNEQLRLAALRDQLVDTVNHEVRTPLSVIMGHAELITEQSALPDDLSWSVGAIDRAAGHLAKVVDTISEIADESLAASPCVPKAPTHAER
jgi:signal transduction histidine kinase